MTTSILFRLLILGATGVVAAGSGYAPASPVSREASVDDAAPLQVAALPAASASYLRVSVTCYGMTCTARAFGGSGVYAGFEWSLAEETWDEGETSGADATAYCVSGAMLGVSVAVTDSNGATAGGGAWVFCP
ncbi:MAG TPA: hypothetical protein VF746_07470 [Longimicrobium sp.]